MTKIPKRLLKGARLYLLDFDGVVTTESEDVGLKVQTLGVFAAVARHFDQRAIKMLRLAGRSIYDTGGSLQLGPLLFRTAQLLKSPQRPLEQTLTGLIDACTDNLDYGGLRPAPAVIHQGIELLKREHIEVAVLTNGVRQHAFNSLALKGLSEHFPRDHIFDAISTRDGHSRLHPKPDPEGIRRVLSELGIAPKHCVFVDNSRKNVRAAKTGAGCRGAVYVGKRLKKKDQGIVDHRADSLEALMTEVVTQLAPTPD